MISIWHYCARGSGPFRVLGRFGSERVVSTGLSRWHTLWGLVPIAGWIWLAVLCFIPPGNFGVVPTAGENEAKGL